MKLLRKYLLLFAILGLAVLAFSVMSHNVSATDHEWTGSISPDASIALNWLPNSVPIATDNVIFDSGYSNPCTFNLAQVANLSILSGYSSTVTQGSNNIISSFYMTGGTFIGAYLLTDSGNFIHTAGSLGSDIISIKMTGNSTMTVYSTYYQVQFHKLWITGHTTITNGIAVGVYNLTIGSNGILTINAPVFLSWGGWKGTATYFNTGTIDGSGILQFYDNGYDWSLSFGKILCNVQIMTDSTSQTYMLTGNATFGSLIIFKNTAGGGCTLDLNNYNLQCNGLTVGTRGILLGRTGQIIDSGNWDSSMGTWTPGTSQINMTSQYKTINIAPGQSFYNLQLVNNINITGAAATVTHLIDYSGLVANAHYHWMNSTLIGNYQANASGRIDIAGRILHVDNLYRMTQYWLPNITSSPVLRVNDNSSYSYSLLADQPGTWAFTSNASFLSMSGNVIFGTPHYEIGSYYVRITFTNSNGTAYQNYTLTVRPEPIITLDLTTVALSIIFLSLVTIFNIYGDFKNALLIQLVAIAIMLPAVVWTFMAISGVWYIPLLFVVVNLVIFVMAAARRK